MIHVGLGKTLFHSSAASISAGKGGPEVTLALSERLLRKKASGAWPERAIQALGIAHAEFISENGDVNRPLLREEGMNKAFPFFDHLWAMGLNRYSSALNPGVEFVSHHLCHAMASLLLSPYEKCLIVVMDGAGTRAADFPPGSEKQNAPAKDSHEECTAYLFDRARTGFELECVFKRWRRFEGELSEGAGIFYETAASHIFGSTRAAGKVMGLAPFGRAKEITGSRIEFLKSLNPERGFRGKSKREWETHPHFQEFCDLAATAQSLFESDLVQVLEDLRVRYPDYGNLILSGGCALNCTFNGKLVNRRLFDSVYVPPFPGDESIGLGAAAASFLRESPELWQPRSMDSQHGYFGPASSLPSDEKRIRDVFADFAIEKPESIAKFAANLLAEGHVIAWFQGRSESGPRALGNRSLLARPDRPGLKDMMNSRIKFRENFRPYGASCAFEKSHEYFNVPEGFHAPFMSFAAQTRPEELERLREVTHIDGTCRFQSVRPGQNARFYELLHAFGERTELYCLLNTSLNVMGEPIVETPEDASGFLKKMTENGESPVHGLAIGDFYVRAARR